MIYLYRICCSIESCVFYQTISVLKPFMHSSIHFVQQKMMTVIDSSVSRLCPTLLFFNQVLNISLQFPLFSICSGFVSELTDHKIKIPTEMMQNLMILHSYILVKVCPFNVFACSLPAELTLPRSGQNTFFFQGKAREFCINLRKYKMLSVSKSVNFILGQPPGLGKGFLVVSKDSQEEIDFSGLIAAFVGKEFDFCSQ